MHRYAELHTYGLSSSIAKIYKLTFCEGGPPHEIVLPLDGDHRGICKFDNEDDPNYRVIHDHLLKVVDSLIGFSKRGATFNSTVVVDVSLTRM